MEVQVAKPLSTEEIFQIAGKKCNVFRYSDLKNIEHIDELFEYNSEQTLDLDLPFDCNSCVIIYLTKDYFGHWCILNRIGKKNMIYSFLDSYGEMLDDQLVHINPKYRKLSGQNSRFLSKILHKAANNGDQVRYNDVQLQVLSDKISTCGRYVALFLKYNKLTVEEFVKTLEKAVKKYKIPIDTLVTLLTI